jgi:hypothetical protein
MTKWFRATKFAVRYFSKSAELAIPVGVLDVKIELAVGIPEDLAPE